MKTMYLLMGIMLLLACEKEEVKESICSCEDRQMINQTVQASNELVKLMTEEERQSFIDGINANLESICFNLITWGEHFNIDWVDVDNCELK